MENHTAIYTNYLKEYKCPLKKKYAILSDRIRYEKPQVYLIVCGLVCRWLGNVRRFPSPQVELEGLVPNAPNILMSSIYAFQNSFSALLVPENPFCDCLPIKSISIDFQAIYKVNKFLTAKQVRGFILAFNNIINSLTHSEHQFKNLRSMCQFNREDCFDTQILRAFKHS